MKVFAVVLAAVASVSCDPYTIGQVAYGYGHAARDGRLHNPGVITGVSYGHHGLYYGKREAEAEPYTLGQVAAGLPIANPYATGHPHNVGYTAYVSHGLGYGHGLYYGKREAEADPKPYTLGQVAAGLPVYNAYATGHPHNVGYTAYVSHGYGLPVYNAYATGHPHNVGY